MPGSGRRKPEESKSQEGSGASVVSTTTLVTELAAGRNPLKSTEDRAGAGQTAGSTTQRQEGKGPERSGTDPKRGTNP